jgi:hypothetical protein
VTIVEILDPRVAVGVTTVATARDLDRPLAGVAVGLRLDHTWRSYEIVLAEWQRRLRAVDANPHLLYTGERVGAGGEKTRADLDEWSRLVDCGVVGLGN